MMKIDEWSFFLGEGEGLLDNFNNRWRSGRDILDIAWYILYRLLFQKIFKAENTFGPHW